MDEAEILKQLRHHIKLWHKGGYISGPLKTKLDLLLFYKDWDIAAIGTKSTRQRSYLIKKYGAICQTPGCGRTTNLTQDHIRPKSRGGSDGLENKQILCRKCNEGKGNKLPNG